MYVILLQLDTSSTYKTNTMVNGQQVNLSQVNKSTQLNKKSQHKEIENKGKEDASLLVMLLVTLLGKSSKPSW